MTTGQPPNAHFASPTMSSVKIEAMNAYVGTANSVPDSRTPRRFASVIKTTNPTAISTLTGWRLGIAEVNANTPATTETATVST